LRNHKQQESEGRLIANEVKIGEKCLELLIAQIRRREEIEKLKLRNERDLIGLDEQMNETQEERHDELSTGNPEPRELIGKHI
jgi:hypothetical protein